MVDGLLAWGSVKKKRKRKSTLTNRFPKAGLLLSIWKWIETLKRDWKSISILLAKMKPSSSPLDVIFLFVLFFFYLVGRNFRVSVNHQKSKPADVVYGLPQGSILGPLIFLLYVLPLVEIIQEFNHIFYHVFADDLQLYGLFKTSEAHKLSYFLRCLANVAKQQELSTNFRENWDSHCCPREYHERHQ